MQLWTRMMSETDLKKRFAELLEKSYKNDTFCFTDFLSPSDAACVYDVAGNRDFSLWGGAEGCERVVIRFGNAEELGYEIPFPIKLLKLEPVNKKFADELSHRDFLGSLMNLGIERDVLGDIVVRDDHAYIFVLEKMAGYIEENLTRVKHTVIKCIEATELPEDVKPVLEECTVILSGVRLDGIISKLYRLSRGDSQELFKENKVLVNGRLNLSASLEPKPDDVIAVRGKGKFIYRGISGETRKGRIAVKVEKYV